MGDRRFLLKELSRYDTGLYADIIYRNALLLADKEAIKCADESITFSQFNERVNSLIHGLLEMGLAKGDVLGILSWNCIEYPDVYGAAMKFGFISSPFNARLQDDELDYLINYSEAKALFVGPEFVEMVDRLKPRIPKVRHFIAFGKNPVPGMLSHRAILEQYSKEEPEVEAIETDPVFLFYTSGTTGIPRAALYTFERAMDDTRRFVIALALEEGDRHIQIMPMFHVGGTKNFWGYFFVGASNVLMPQISFDPRATLRAIQEEKATDIQVVATHLAAFLALADVDTFDLSTLKRVFYASSPMPFELLRRSMEKWGSIFLQFYGSTETGPDATMLTREQHDVLGKGPELERRLTSCGFPLIGVQVRIVDDRDNDLPPGEVGEIIVRSKAILSKWWKKPQETAETIVNGWLHTGDMARYDGQGYIYIVDRKRDMICSGGENVYPREVEGVLCQHPAVLEAAVIGVPDDYWVERVHAVVVLKEGKSTTGEDIVDFCKSRLARYKAPKSIEFVTKMPKNAANKILKHELRDKYWLGRDRKLAT